MRRISNIQEYITPFNQKLSLIDIETLTVKPYYKGYLGHLLQHSRYYLEVYASVLMLLLKNSTVSKEKTILIDYGAGNGLLGLFAKFCGFGQVYINDINKEFIDSAVELSLQLNSKIDGFITGDIVTISNFFKEQKPTAIVGTDVIEHIYDLSVFFNKIKEINPTMVSVFTTASNPYNKYKIQQLKKLQRKDEYEGGHPDDNLFFGETAHEPFIKIREKIIRDNFPELSGTEVLKLAALTRGLIYNDIIATVRRYSIDGILPVAPTHPTNTCDPISGSWTERILSIKEYKTIYKNAGFSLSICSGFYNEFNSGPKKNILKMANTGIKIIGPAMAPFISLVGIPEN